MSRCKWVGIVALVVVGAWTIPHALAKPLAAQEPALVVQAKSINGLLADLKYLAQLFDRGDQVDQLDGVIAAVGGPQGLAGSGLDVERPFLAYVVAAPGGLDSPFAILVPIANEQTLLTLLANLSIIAKKDNNDVYTLDIPGQLSSIYFKFANKYVYITALDKRNLDSTNLVAPESLVTNDEKMVLGVTLRLDRVPDQLKQLALGQIELRLADVKDRAVEGETKDQERMRKRGIDTLSFVIKSIVSEGKSVQLQSRINRERDDIDLSVSLDGKEDTFLAQGIAMLGEGKSRLAVADAPALHVGLNLTVPAPYRPFVELAAKDAVERQSDPGKKALMSKLYDALLPTLQRGELDAHLAWMSNGDQGYYSAIGGVAVDGGQKVAAVAKEVVGQLPASNQKSIKLDAAKVGDMQVHQVYLDGMQMDKRVGRLFGIDPPNMWTAFGPQAVMLGFGLDSTQTISGLKALGQPKPSPAIVVEAAFAQLAPLDETHPGAAKLAQTVFSKSTSGSDAVRLSLDGGKSLKFSASFKGLVLKFLHLLHEQPPVL